MTKITERGMIFNGEMVRALLSGRKTQTRRIIKPQPEVTLSGSLSGKWLSRPLNGLLLPKIEDIAIHCPFGAVGDRIWVRETWGVVSHAFSDDGLMIDWVPDRPATAIHEMPFGNGYYSGYAIYATDGDFTWVMTMVMKMAVGAGNLPFICREQPAAFCWKSPTCALSAYAA